MPPPNSSSPTSGAVRPTPATSASTPGATPAPRLILIPAFEPEPILLEVVAALSATDDTHLIIVDDGSGPAYQDLFRQLEMRPGVDVLRHAINLGKGAALKTGLNHAHWRYPHGPGVVTADADGQHTPADIRKVAAAQAAQPHQLVLGARQLVGGNPWRSRLGNRLTCLLFQVLYGQKLIDTQTGLRGIPRSLIPELLRLPSTGYEFELEMLVLARWQKLPVTQVAIQTVYHDGNRCSHFNPVRDSFRVYQVLLRFLAIAATGALVDSGAFALIFAWSQAAFGAQIVARVLAAALQLRLQRRLFARLTDPPRLFQTGYVALIALFTATSYGLMQWLHQRFGYSMVGAKWLAEAGLFLLHYHWMQRYLRSRTALISPDATTH